MKKCFLTRLKFHVTLVLFLSSSLTWLSAQQWRYLSEEESYKKSAEALKNADYIFEGYPAANVKFYYNQDSTETLRSIELEVIHCYKGNLRIGTIELIRPMRDEHTTGLETRVKYIFVCQKTDLLRRGDASFDNSQPVQLFNEYVPCLKVVDKPETGTQATGGLFNRYFPTKDSFHVFLKQASGDIILPATPGKTNITPLPKDNSPVPKPDTTDGGGNFRLGEVNETIRYSIRNQRVYNANGKNYYAFDVYGQVFTSGLKLSLAFVKLTFNKATFGFNPNPSYRWVGTAGPGVPLSAVAVSGSNTPNDTTIQLSIGPTSVSLPNDTFRLATIHLEVGLDTVCCKWSSLTFQPNDMASGSAYYITNPTPLLNFNVETLPIQNYKLCSQPMTITSVSPSLVHAGVMHK